MTDFDEDRELCPDGTCIGVIGANGRCKVCGTPFVGTLAPSVRADDGDDEDDEDLDDEEDALEADAADAMGSLEVDDDDDRQLCPDGACIGLIGSDGKCKVCGTPAGS